MKEVGPREDYDLAGVPWEHRATRHELVPHNLSQAIAIAFSAACSGLLNGLAETATAEGRDLGRPRRAAYADLAGRLGMTRDPLRRTFSGQRWLRLPEMQSVLEEADLGLGDLFAAELDSLLRSYPQVMQSDAFLRPEVVPPSVTPMLGGEEDIPMSYVVALEQRVRENVRVLALLQEAARRRSRAWPGWTDWAQVSVLLGYGPTPDVVQTDTAAEQLEALGLTVAQLVREALLASDKPLPSNAVGWAVEARVRFLQREHRLPATPLREHAVLDALAYLRKRDEVERPRRGVYGATARMKGYTEKR